MDHHLTLTLLEPNFAVCQLAHREEFPSWIAQSEVWSLTHTRAELTAVCDERFVPLGVRADSGWKCLRLEGQFDFATTGILASIVGPLAAADVSIFAFSTFDTDYVLIRSAHVSATHQTLAKAGHAVLHSPRSQ